MLMEYRRHWFLHTDRDQRKTGDLRLGGESKGLPRVVWCGPFVKSAGGNHATPLGERLGEGWPTLRSFSFGILGMLPLVLLMGKNDPRKALTEH